MKRYIKIFALALSAALALISCNSVGDMAELPSGVLTITLDSGSMTTKADATAPTFETAIDHFDFFFFEDEDGTTPIPGIHGYVEGRTKVLNTAVGSEFETLRSRTSYVYIVANWPESFDHTRDWTLAQLLESSFSSDIVTGVDPDTGAATFCSSLVMDSYDVGTGKYTTELTPKAYEEERDVTIKLSRIASKFTMTITIPKSVAAKDAGASWTPMNENLQAYYVNALNAGTTLGAVPVHRETEDGYFSYPGNYPLTKTGETETAFTYEVSPAYTYPQTWASTDNGEPYFKIFMPWMHSVNGSSNFYYKVVAPKPADGTFTIDRNTWYKLSVTLSVVDTAEEYVNLDFGVIVSPWMDGIQGGAGIGVARFFNVPVKRFNLYSQEDLNIPYSSSSTIKAYFTKISYDFYGTNDSVTYTHNYTEEDNVTQITLAPESAAAASDPNEYKLELAGKNVVFSHSVANIFTVRRIELVIKNLDGKSETVVIEQHPAIELMKHFSYNMFIDGYFGHVLEPGYLDDNGVKIPFARHNEYVDYYGTTVYGSSRGFTRAMAETAYAYNDHDDLFKTNALGAIGMNPRQRYLSKPYLTEIVVSAFNEDNDTYQIYFKQSFNSSTSTLQTRHYVIGDPRQKASEANLYNNTATWVGGSTYRYLIREDYTYNTSEQVTGYTEVRGSWQQAGSILIGSTSSADRSVIAPRFLLSSTLNVSRGTTYEGARRRAAVYQEEGYPAGRWRLPTEAEIAFIIARQNDGSLPVLFNPNQYYWTAEGRLVNVGSQGDIPFTVPGQSTYPLRFIYDLWYWGDEDETLDKGVYHPNMHLVKPNQN